MDTRQPRQLYTDLQAELGNAIHGYDYAKQRLIIALVADGHVIFRAVPGVGKTTLAKAMQSAIRGARGARIQFTPDLMPGDITGYELFNPKEGVFERREGPIKGINILLADEINRTQPKTQSAMLEAMQERQMTVNGVTTELEDPFLVIATENPIEQAGTYTLPEALLDRFCFLLDLDYATEDDEMALLGNLAVHGRNSHQVVSPVIDLPQVLELRQQSLKIAKAVTTDAKRYIVSLMRATRPTDPLFQKVVGEDGKTFEGAVELGASPRAGIWMLHTAAVHTLLSGRAAILPEDIHFVAKDVLRHRIFLSSKATRVQKLTPDKFVDAILRSAPIVQCSEWRS